MNKKITMKDIASYLNIDRTTVSKALNKHPDVAQSTIQKVMEAAEALGYRKDHFASGLYTGKNNVLGLILADMRRGIFAPLIENFQRIARMHNYGVILYYFLRQKDDMADALDLLKQQRVSGATFITSAATALKDTDLIQLTKSGISVNTLGRGFIHRQIDSIELGHFQAGIDMTNYLIQLGHQRITFVTYAGIKGTPEERLNGYIHAMKAAGLQPSVVAEDVPVSHVPGDEMMVAYERIRKVWDRLGAPTALIGVNDHFALGILHALREKNIAVPEEISVSGFDDLHADLGFPQLTSMRMPSAKSGERLAELLIERIHDNAKSSTQIMFNYELIVRKSTDRVIKK